jgi:hypothetical protein
MTIFKSLLSKLDYDSSYLDDHKWQLALEY